MTKCKYMIPGILSVTSVIELYITIYTMYCHMVYSVMSLHTYDIMYICYINSSSAHNSMVVIRVISCVSCPNLFVSAWWCSLTAGFSASPSTHKLDPQVSDHSSIKSGKPLPYTNESNTGARFWCWFVLSRVMRDDWNKRSDAKSPIRSFCKSKT